MNILMFESTVKKVEGVGLAATAAVGGEGDTGQLLLHISAAQAVKTVGGQGLSCCGFLLSVALYRSLSSLTNSILMLC